MASSEIRFHQSHGSITDHKPDKKERRGRMVYRESLRNSSPRETNLSLNLPPRIVELIGRRPRLVVWKMSDPVHRYHSHSRGQNMDGLYGPIYIRFVHLVRTKSRKRLNMVLDLGISVPLSQVRSHPTRNLVRKSRKPFQIPIWS